MNEAIKRRKSIRKYIMEPLAEKTLVDLREQFTKIVPLYPEINYSIDIVSKTKGLFGIAAPHYLVFYSQEKEGYLENIGYIGQHISLYLTKNGIGSCWLGMAKPKDVGDYPFVICMAFGNPGEELYRSLAEFNRKRIEEISSGEDERLEAARLAPSGMNHQNWNFVAEDGLIHCYIKKNMMMRLATIDIGIALAHISAESERFSFSKADNAQHIDKHIYIGTVGE